MAAVTRETAHMVTIDGVRLDADVWRPPGGGPWPVLLMRQPYGRVDRLHRRLRAPGLVRGARVPGGDPGCARPRHVGGRVPAAASTSARTAAETVAWAAALPGSSGRVGMYWFLLSGHDPVAGRGGDGRRRCAGDRAGDGGVGCARGLRDRRAARSGCRPGFGWGCQLALETARRAGRCGRAPGDLRRVPRAAAARRDAVPAADRGGCWGRHGHYLEWLTEPDGAEYWARVSPNAPAGAIDVPALHIGGWYDALLGGTLACYRGPRAERAGHSRQLVVGPWVHIPWSRHVGARDFGPDAAERDRRAAAALVRSLAEGRPGAWDAAARPRCSNSGGQWRQLHTLARPRRRRPGASRSSGRAGMDGGGRHAGSRARPAAAWTSSSTTRGARRPRWAATPGSRPGRWTAPLVDARGDVLTYTTRAAGPRTCIWRGTVTRDVGRDGGRAPASTCTPSCPNCRRAAACSNSLAAIARANGVGEGWQPYAASCARVAGRQPFAPVGCRRAPSRPFRSTPAPGRPPGGGAPDRPAHHHRHPAPRRLGAPFANLTKTARGPYGSRNKGLEPRTSSQALLAMTWWFERWQCRAHGRGPSHHFAAASRLAAASLNTRSSTLARRPRSLARAR